MQKRRREKERSLLPPEALVEGIAHAAHGADGIDLAAALETLAQTADMHIDGALVESGAKEVPTLRNLSRPLKLGSQRAEVFRQGRLPCTRKHMKWNVKHARPS